MSRVVPVFPGLVEASKVNCSNVPRAIEPTSDVSRVEEAAETDGKPTTEFDGNSNPYVDYQFIDLLHTLQVPRSNAYDESCFIVMGQAKELLFQGLHFELFNARAQVAEDNIDEALVMLSRARAFAQYITQSWDVLSTITAEGFNEFRDSLGQASGQLSFMYRHVEFVLGSKNIDLAQAHDNMPHVYPQIDEALQAKSLYDEVIAALARAGYHIDADILDRDWSVSHQATESVEDAWLQVYEGDAADQFHALAEALVALDDQLSQYRWRHFTSVSRIIGGKPGTGGSAGVGWLRHVTDHRYFPELWTVRTRFSTGGSDPS